MTGGQILCTLCARLARAGRIRHADVRGAVLEVELDGEWMLVCVPCFEARYNSCP